MAFLSGCRYFIAMKLRCIFFFVFGLTTLINAGAQTVSGGGSGELALTVEESVRIALDNNLSLMRNAIDLNGKQRAADRSWNTLIPTITTAAVAGHPTSITDEIPPAQDIWLPGFQVSATLNLSVSTIDNIKKARSDYEAGILTYELAKQRLELQVRKLFYQLILMESGRELAERSFESAQARCEQISALVKAGQAARLDEVTARVDMENKRPNVRNASTQYENALDSFKTLLGLPREQALALSGTLHYGDSGITGETPRAESLEAAAFQKYITSLEAQRNAARNGAYVPAISLSWKSTPLYNVKSDKWNDSESSFTIGLGFSLDNFLPWSAAKTRIDSLNDSIRSAEIQLSETLRDRESRITQYRRTIEQAKENIAALHFNVELAQTTYALYEEAYRNGAADYQRLRDADDSLLLAQNRVQQEQYNLISAILDLERELNVPFGTIK
jgi:outer membrane protein TolC